MKQFRIGTSLLTIAFALGLHAANAQTQLDGEQPATEPATELGVPTDDVPAEPGSAEPIATDATQPPTTDVTEPSEATAENEGGSSDAGTAQALADDNAPDTAQEDEANTAEAQGEGEAELDTEENADAAGGGETGEIDCEQELAGLEDQFGQFREEAQAALKEMAAEAPLILLMADGSVVDMRAEDDITTGPVENWFGDPPVRKAVRSGLDSARSAFDSGDREACLEALREARGAIDGFQTVSAETDAEGEEDAETDEQASQEQPESEQPAEGQTAEQSSDGSAQTEAGGTDDASTADVGQSDEAAPADGADEPSDSSGSAASEDAAATQETQSEGSTDAASAEGSNSNDADADNSATNENAEPEFQTVPVEPSSGQ